MKVFFIIALAVLIVANLLPYGRLGVSERTSNIVRKAFAILLVAASIGYFVSSL